MEFSVSEMVRVNLHKTMPLNTAILEFHVWTADV